MRIRIYVNKKHIQKGVRGSYHYCPIAIALKSKGHENVYVAGLTTTINGKHFRIGKTGACFIHDFDNGYKVKPKHIYLYSWKP